jgi:hypothetical protein
VYIAATVFRVSDGEAAYCHIGHEGGVEQGVIQLEKAMVHYMLVAYVYNAASISVCTVENDGMVSK